MAQAESTRIAEKSSPLPNRKKRITKQASRPSHTTVEMVDVALLELRAHTKKGTTLQAIKKFVSTKFEITINKQRSNLIGNYLRNLLSVGNLVNVNGKGLVGHLRLLRNTSLREKTKKKPAHVKKSVVVQNTQRRNVGLFSPIMTGTETVFPEINAPVRRKPTKTASSRAEGDTPVSSLTRKRNAKSMDVTDEPTGISSRLRSKDNISKGHERSKRRLFRV